MGSYVVGLIVLAAVAGPFAWAAVGARRALLPGWSGAPAMTVDLVGFAALATAVPVGIGAVGLFHPLPLIAGSVVVSLVVRALVPPGPREVPVPGPAPTSTATRLAAAVAAAMAGPWAVWTVQAYRYGSQSYDTLNYHLPFVARWVLTGSTGHVQNVFPGIAAPSYITPYHPLSAEVLHALGMVAFHRDLLSPLINVFWLVLLAAAAYAIGAPRGRGPHCMALALVAADCPLMIASQPGTAMTDLALVASCVAIVAVLVQGVPVRSVAVPLGAALGLAAGVKLNALPLVAVVWLGAAVLAGPGARVATAGRALVVALLVGGFWYARDWAAVGTPVPSLVSSVGAASAHVDTFSVAHYLTQPSVMHQWFEPALRIDFGSWWPVWLLLALLGTVAGLWRLSGAYRLVAIASAVALVSYLLTPTTAFGPPGQPTLFLLDVRYAMVFVALGAVLLGLLADAAVYVAALGAVAILVCPVTWPLPPHPGVGWRAIGLTVSVVAVAVALLRLRSVWIPGLVALVVSGYLVATRWIPRQYQGPTDSPVLAWGWGIHHQRIAFVGLAFSYPLSGYDLTNYVQYLGETGPRHAFDNPPTCAAFRRLLDDGRYGYVVFANSDPKGPLPGEDAWVRGAAGAVPVLTTPSATAYRVTHRLDPSACPAAP